LSYLGHALVENRNGCVRYSELAPFDGLIWPHL
jgi:hypothetical protein